MVVEVVRTLSPKIKYLSDVRLIRDQKLNYRRQGGYDLLAFVSLSVC